MRRWISWLLTIFSTLVVVPFLQFPATKLAETLHFDQILFEENNSVTAWIWALSGNRGYVFISGLLLGSAASLFLSNVLRPYMRKREIWNQGSMLSLAFSHDIQNATTITQKGVLWYYWYHFPGLQIDFEVRSTQQVPGYLMIFLSLKHPTYTNYSKVSVPGGGLHCEIVSASSAGAMLRIIGNVGGRTVNIEFSSKPIPL